jgi:hypothetical protein
MDNSANDGDREAQRRARLAHAERLHGAMRCSLMGMTRYLAALLMVALSANAGTPIGGDKATI